MFWAQDSELLLEPLPVHLTQVEREKLRSHEDTVRLSAEKGRLDRSLTGAEQELAKAQRQIQQLEVWPHPPRPAPPPPALVPRGAGGPPLGAKQRH